MSSSGVAQVYWFILTHRGVPHTPRNGKTGLCRGSVPVIFLKSTHQWRTSKLSFSSWQRPRLHRASSPNNGGAVALFCHGSNQTVSNMMSICEFAMYTQHFDLNLNQIVRPGHVDLFVGNRQFVHGQY